MAKILREGRKQTGWAIERYCLGPIVAQVKMGCGATILVEEGDLTKRHHTDYVGDTDTWYEWVCPACGCHNKISSWEIP